MSDNPGPWRVGRIRDGHAEIDNARGETVLECRESVAQLVAAAPDLLKACKAAAEALEPRQFSYGDGDEWNNEDVIAALAVVRAAIEKATKGGA